MTAFARGSVFVLGAWVALAAFAVPAQAAPSGTHVQEVCRTLTEDANFKVRVQAALVLGKIGDVAGTPCLVRALNDQNRTVRAMSAQALGQIGDASVVEALRGLAKRDLDSFVRAQAEKAVALLSGPPTATGVRSKIFLTFGPFTGGTKTAGSDAIKMVRDVLQNELAKLPVVTMVAAPAGAKPAAPAFWIDGNIARLDDAGGGEVSCGVKVTVARWPSKSIISWTSADAGVQSGSRPRDRENARKDCLEATASQLAEDLAKFLKAQGG